MTVTGATTAGVASVSYTPPFKSVSTNPSTVQITGSVTSAVNNNPTVSAGTSDSDYAWAYLQAHMMSPPSYRYAYLLWFVLAAIAIIYAIAHHLRLSGGSFGAAFAAFGMRRHTLGSKKPGRRNRALPSNNVILTLALITAITILLALIGADYIVPTSSTLDFSTSFRKRAALSNTAPAYTIGKSFWTLGSRFGFIAFALMPAVVLFALKSPPVGFLSLRVLTQLYADKLSLLHRGVGWLVWAVTTVHVVLWTVQLFEDSRNGRATWFYLWTNYRFIFGCVAYFALTAVMALSLRPIRKNQYEFFYITHVVLVILTLAACAVHHPVLWYWMAAAGGLWALERISRFIRFVRINALFGKRRVAPLQAGPHYAYLSTTENDHENAYDMHEFKPAVVDHNRPVSDKTLPRLPAREGTPDREFGQRNSGGFYDDGSLQPLGSYESRYDNAAPYTDPYAPSTATSSTFVSEDAKLPRDSSVHNINRHSTATAQTLVAPDVPVGFAQAQLLPSRTVRLTVKVPKPFKWAAGQSCLLYLPDLSTFQSHPFTIVNNPNESEMVLLVKARKGLTRKLYDHVRSRSMALLGGGQGDGAKGFSGQAGHRPGEGVLQMPPVHVRTWVDGPLGSAKRVRWNEFSSIVIICGGSGVSFGASVCDHVCQLLANNRDIGSSKVKTQRVRFCWVVREYAEIAWVAGQLYRCKQLVTAAQLEISIFVTHAAKHRGDAFAPPQPGFARYNRRDSADSLASDMSRESGPMDLELDEPIDSPNADRSTQYADVIDLTNYDDEEDINDPAEQELSTKIQHQGKVRRARSRKAAKGATRERIPSATKSTMYPPPRRGPSMLSMDDASQQYAAAAGGDAYAYDTIAPETRIPLSASRGSFGPDKSPFAGGTPTTSRYSLSATAAAPPDPYAPPPPLLASNRHSYRSFADSTYGMYDPYAGGPGMHGPSPSPSIIFDDDRSIAGESTRNMLSRASRTGSMVFLEDGGGAAGNGKGGSVTASGAGEDGGLWVDQADYAAMSVMSEMARPGKPKLSAVLEEEIARAGGAMIVATCGPVTLNTVVRNLVAKHISPTRIRHGDKRGHIAIYSEDYES